MKIQTRMLFFAATLMLVVTSVMLAGLVALQRRQVREQEARRLDSIMESVERTAKEALAQKDDLMLLSHLRFQLKEYPSIEIWMVTRSGHTSILGQIKTPLVYRDLTVSYPETGPGKESVHIQAGFSKSRLESRFSEGFTALLGIALVMTAVGLVLGLAGALWISHKMAKPIVELSAAAEKFGRGDFNTTVKTSGNDEITTLGKAFNHMATNIAESVNSKEDLLSTLTHELNNPLAGLKAFIALLRNPLRINTIQETREAYETMSEAVEQMELIISNALELFKASAKPALEKEMIDLEALCKEVTSLYGPVAGSNHIELNMFFPEKGVDIVADRKLLRRVIVNLVSNALKYTPQRGKITISVSEKDGNVIFSVADTGYGISAEDKKQLFTKFYRTREKGGKKIKIPGSGLGLAIAKKAVEMHNGMIWVESEKGKGSTFYFSLPKQLSGETV